MPNRARAGMEHVAAFDAAVDDGDWDRFSRRFAEDAVMVLHGVPVGPYEGRAAIAAAYVADPPDEPLEVVGPVTLDGEELVMHFCWVDSGGTGTMRLRLDPEGLVARLEVAFDDDPDTVAGRVSG